MVSVRHTMLHAPQHVNVRISCTSSSVRRKMNTENGNTNRPGSPQRGLDEPVRIRAGSGATIRGSTRITAYPATDPAPKPGAKIRMGR